MALQRGTAAASRAGGAPPERVSTNARRLKDQTFETADVMPMMAAGLPAVVDRRSDAAITARLNSTDPAAFISEIESLWHRTQENFLAIGRALIAARDLIERQTDVIPLLPPAERRSRRDSSWREFLGHLPFNPSIASQLECVARDVERGRLKREELPATYSVAYQLTTLTDMELEAARRIEGIVCPSVTRSRINEYKKTLRQKRLDHQHALRAKHQRLLVALERLRREIDEVEREMAVAETEQPAQPPALAPEADGAEPS